MLLHAAASDSLQVVGPDAPLHAALDEVGDGSRMFQTVFMPFSFWCVCGFMWLHWSSAYHEIFLKQRSRGCDTLLAGGIARLASRTQGSEPDLNSLEIC